MLIALSYTSEKVSNHNANVISTTVKRSQGKVTLNSFHHIEPHPQLSTKVGNLQFGEYLKIMFVPIAANGSHIIGVNVLDDRYVHAWHIERTTVDRVSHVFLEIYAQSRENVESFDLSYILIEKVTTSCRDAIEIWRDSMWHIEFGDVYDSQEFGAGTWVPFSDVSRCFKSDEEKLEFREVFNAKFQWGPFPTAADHSLPTFAYVEPTLLHTDIPYIEGKTVREMVEYCPTKSEMGEILMMEDNWLIPKLKEEINFGFPHEGIGLDSMININPTYQLDNCKDDIPYYLVDLNGNPFVETSGCHFRIMKRERGNATRGYVINSANSLPQNVPFLATSGYETLLSSSPNIRAYTDHYIMMWGRDSMLALEHLFILRVTFKSSQSCLFLAQVLVQILCGANVRS